MRQNSRLLAQCLCRNLANFENKVNVNYLVSEKHGCSLLSPSVMRKQIIVNSKLTIFY